MKGTNIWFGIPLFGVGAVFLWSSGSGLDRVFAVASAGGLILCIAALVRFYGLRRRSASAISQPDALTSGMARIAVIRRFESDGVLRRATITVDGSKVGKLRVGETFSVDVSPGTHVVQVSMDSGRSPKVECALDEGQTVRMEMSAANGSATTRIANSSAAYFELRILDV